MIEICVTDGDFLVKMTADDREGIQAIISKGLAALDRISAPFQMTADNDFYAVAYIDFLMARMRKSA